MYQTVGHDAIHFYADCMELPLYRREITGQPIAQDSEYTTTTNDETEDLFFLIKEILVRNRIWLTSTLLLYCLFHLPCRKSNLISKVSLLVQLCQTINVCVWNMCKAFIFVGTLPYPPFLSVLLFYTGVTDLGWNHWRIYGKETRRSSWPKWSMPVCMLYWSKWRLWVWRLLILAKPLDRCIPNFVH